MILAAGRGERMRPLTDRTPKPLLPAAGKPLIVWHLERLAKAGIRDIVINHAHLGDQIEALLDDGSAWGVAIRYSAEPPGALETAGGIANALPMLAHELGDEPFLVVNGDIWCDLDFATLPKLANSDLAHLVLVPNPEHNANGDFDLQAGRVCSVPPRLTSPKGAGRHEVAVPSGARDGATLHTFSGIGIYRSELFATIGRGKPAKLAPLLREAMADDRVSGQIHIGRWVDVGTPERLAKLDAEVRASL
jgi:MurNAc alpha-1-phosphate uridylyltransferase